MPSRTDTAGHTTAFDYPVAEHWGKAEMSCSASGTRADNTGIRLNRRTYINIRSLTKPQKRPKRNEFNMFFFY